MVSRTPALSQPPGVWTQLSYDQTRAPQPADSPSDLPHRGAKFFFPSPWFTPPSLTLNSVHTQPWGFFKQHLVPPSPTAPVYTWPAEDRRDTIPCPRFRVTSSHPSENEATARHSSAPSAVDSCLPGGHRLCWSARDCLTPDATSHADRSSPAHLSSGHQASEWTLRTKLVPAAARTSQSPRRPLEGCPERTPGAVTSSCCSESATTDASRGSPERLVRIPG